MQTIRELRERHGWSQVEVANRVGVTPSAVYNWEKGKNEPRLTQLRALSRVFGVSLDQLALNDNDRACELKTAA